MNKKKITKEEIEEELKKGKEDLKFLRTHTLKEIKQNNEFAKLGETELLTEIKKSLRKICEK